MRLSATSLTLTATMAYSMVGLTSAALPSIQTGPMLPLTKDKITVMTYAAELAADVYYPELMKENHPEAAYIESLDGVDAMATVDIDSYCFVVFRGTAGETKWQAFQDWVFQNLDIMPVPLETRSNPEERCMVQRGFLDAYSGGRKDELSFAPIIDTFVDACMSQGNKQLIFTGHSQGAATSGIASIIHSGHNPLVMAFAQPNFLQFGDHCTNILNPEHNWRIVNTENDIKRGLQYDLVAMLPAVDDATWLSRMTDVVGPSIGPQLLLPPNDSCADRGKYDFYPPQKSVVVRDASDPEPWMQFGDLDIGNDGDGMLSVHFMSRYLYKMKKLLEIVSDGDEPLDVNGFIDGTECQADFECYSYNTKGLGGCYAHRCIDRLHTEYEPCLEQAQCEPNLTCVKDVCYPGNDGDPCQNGHDCKSGRCENNGYLQFGSSCEAKKAVGEGCNEDSDCLSEKCRWFKCAEAQT